MIRLSLIFFLLWTGLAIAQNEEEDKGYLVNLLEENLSGEDQIVTINGFEGALSSEAHIAQLTIADADGVWLELTNAKLIWTRSALLRGAIEIDELSAERLSVLRPPNAGNAPPSPEATVFALPELPVSISLGSLDIAQISLGDAFFGEAINVSLTGSASLSGGEGTAAILANRLDERAGKFEINGSYSNSTNVLDIDVDLNEAPEGIVAHLLDVPGKPSVRLNVVGRGPISDYLADIRLDTDGQERVSGSASVLDVELGTEFALNLDGDVTTLFAPEYQSFFGRDVALAANGLIKETGQFSLSELKLTAQHVDITGTADISAEGWPERIYLKGSIADPNGQAVLLPLSGPKTQVARLDLDLNFDQQISDDWTGTVAFEGFQRPGLDIAQLSIDGTGIIDADGGRFAGDVAYAAGGITLDDSAASEALGKRIAGQLLLSKEPEAPLSIETLTLNGAGLDLQATATVQGAAESFETDATILTKVAGLERFQTLIGQPIEGAASLAIIGTVRPLDGIFDLLLSGETTDLAVGVDQVDALTRGEGKISARFARDTQGTTVESLKVETVAAIITGDAMLSSTGGNVDVMARVHDISPVVEGLIGPANVSADAVIDPNGTITFNAKATATDALISATGTVSQDGEGRLVSALITSDLNDLRSYAALVGQPTSGAIRAQIQGQLHDNPLRAQGQITATTQNLAIGNSSVDTLLRGDGNLRAEFTRTGSKFALRDIAINTPNVNVTAELDTHESEGTANFQARLRDIGLFTDTISGPLTTQGTAERTSNKWAFEIGANGPAGITATSSGTYDDNGRIDARMRGDIPLGLANAALEPRRLEGRADFDLTMAGPLNVSALSGRIATNGARLALPTLAQAIEGIDGSVTLQSGNASIDISGGVKSGGQINVSGPVSLSSPFQSDVSVALTNVVLRDPTLYETIVNGRIGANGPLAGGASISGALTLGATEVRVPSSGVGALGNLPEIRHIGQSSAVSRTLERAGVTENQSANDGRRNGPNFPLNIAINAPSRIFVRGRGLDAELGGSLTVGGSTSNIQPVGRFDLIRGRLDILQQRFNLTEGSATLQGDFEPHLRLIAQTEAATGTIIRIVVEGPASEPDVRFESSPELPQDEVLSQLIFGRDISEISPLQAVQLAAAVGTLAGRGGGGVIDNFRQNLGLADFDVTTDNDGNAAVRAGAYLSENIYTDVTVSSDGSTEINLNLDITNDVTAKGSVDADGETSIGIFYEKDY